MRTGQRSAKDLSGLILAFVALSFFFAGPAKASGANPLREVPAGKLELFWITEADRKSGLSPFVEVAAFSAQEHAVTNDEFLRFLRQAPQWRRSRVSSVFAESGYLSDFRDDLRVKRGVDRSAPVTYVSWFAARAYCESLGLRLPTVMEWEYMAAASETVADASRNAAFLARILEWYGKPRPTTLPKVRSTYRNLYGLYDLHGLVWEWVEDFNSATGTGESREDPALNRDLFCGAGNLAGGNKENYAAFMRYAFRSSLKGKGVVWNLGFRCVK